MLSSIFMLGLRSIRRNLLRSFLTILGIVIGVSAVITMVTLGNGATKAIQAKISSLGTADGLSNNDVRVILRSRDSSLWVGTLGGGLNRYKDGKFSVLTEKDGLAKNQVLSLHEDADGVRDPEQEAPSLGRA